MPKLNRVAAGVARMLTEKELEGMSGYVQQSPTMLAVQRLATRIAARFDAALQAAVERYLGEPLKDPELLRGRLHCREEAGGETYAVDGVPVLWAGPVSSEHLGRSISAEQKLVQLLPEDFKPGAAP